jgi:predicted RNA binding protein YcfA (HicA-like mRNA interferase family)
VCVAGFGFAGGRVGIPGHGIIPWQVDRRQERTPTAMRELMVAYSWPTEALMPPREVSAQLGRLSPAATTVGLMPPLPRITGRELVSALGKLGWRVAAQRGSHAQLQHPGQVGRVTVPVHAGETIGPGLLRSILSQAGVTADELRRVL